MTQTHSLSLSFSFLRIHSFYLSIILLRALSPSHTHNRACFNANLARWSPPPTTTTPPPSCLGSLCGVVFRDTTGRHTRRYSNVWNPLAAPFWVNLLMCRHVFSVLMLGTYHQRSENSFYANWSHQTELNWLTDWLEAGLGLIGICSVDVWTPEISLNTTRRNLTEISPDNLSRTYIHTYIPTNLCTNWLDIFANTNCVWTGLVWEECERACEGASSLNDCDLSCQNI